MNIDDAAVRTLQSSTPLHVLTISRATLPLVRMAYDQDPLALTDDVLQDAFSKGARQDVVQFLVQKKGTDSYQVSHMMGQVFLEAISVLQPPQPAQPADNTTTTTTGDTISQACQALQRLNDLCHAFPESLINTDPNKLCPVSIVLGCTAFPMELLESMIRLVPTNESRFTLRGDGNLPTDHTAFFNAMRHEFDDRCMAAIGLILTKVSEFHCRWEHWTERTFQQFLTHLFASTCAVREMHMDIWPFSFDKTLAQLMTPVPSSSSQQKCNLRDISISFVGTERKPDFSILTPLLQLNCFDGVEIYIAKPWKVNSFICDTLCKLMGQGRLQSLDLIAQTDSDTLFLPLIHAAHKSQNLCDLRLQNLQHPGAVKRAQETVLSHLEQSNTKLEVALISDSYLTSDTILEHSGTRMQAHVNPEWFLERKQGNPQQRQIDYWTLLNICGRARARDTKHMPQKELCAIVSQEALEECLEFLDIPVTAKQDFITNMQYGLLREAPTIWLPKSNNTISTRQSKRKRKHSTKGTRKSTRKRRSTTTAIKSEP
ncbi:expressed unknown protein [Seminavis robusta]|uniref:Uncharacterized protein n=1 Tax=Seminavis robusta TaxID=568900 RepID=A0A9N8H628_9STRA|nr:expressed unknown protein [Seminavis robusta]|eukprot:Sro133_g062860.1 n/a (543) ;mRNA; r:10020-11746